MAATSLSLSLVRPPPPPPPPPPPRHFFSLAAYCRRRAGLWTEHRSGTNYIALSLCLSFCLSVSLPSAVISESRYVIGTREKIRPGERVRQRKKRRLTSLRMNCNLRWNRRYSKKCVRIRIRSALFSWFSDIFISPSLSPSRSVPSYTRACGQRKCVFCEIFDWKWEGSRSFLRTGLNTKMFIRDSVYGLYNTM